MSDRFLLDENLPTRWRKAVLQRRPHLHLWCVGDVGAPPKQTPDPTILAWCEARDAYLLTNNRHSMPGHLVDFVGQGRHVPGIFLVGLEIGMDVVAGELALIAWASLPDEFRDQINYLPMT